ncbi:alpha/beta hydrolase [Micromonospora sp. 4G57]|uniref:Alpha/beta hydrolase n=1 Tax=Micromonospora sicca TaxID=2202420 RepID=A0ABU5JEG7_9ACTN|nr:MULTISPECIES: alpha/beta hydrolase [unclassified Micromonospora]MDZ5445147.1 alpha/beta hydrolase [Micromonospora sp. 4G57]MDZ5490976.1 alpha/beta hydrolase [Micromonospora sp. 4G53]
MFEGFEEVDVATADTTIHGRRGGDGPPVLLLHGMPETHLMWHRIAPRLAERFTVVATDLRGFGDSGKPPTTPDHAPYSMREVAREQVEVMRLLGYDTFAVVGHDRGARCAYRMALDHPDTVTRLAVLDIVPTGDAFGRADMDFSLGFWLWSFLAAPEPVPERLVAQAPEVIVDYMLDSLSEVPDAFPAAVRAEYVAKLSAPDVIHAICEQYRAAAGLDYQHDEADRGNRRIRCPVLALWSHAGPVASWYRPLEVWRAWADQVDGGPVKAGHFLPEEAPDETARHLLTFLT